MAWTDAGEGDLSRRSALSFPIKDCNSVCCKELEVSEMSGIFPCSAVREDDAAMPSSAVTGAQKEQRHR